MCAPSPPITPRPPDACATSRRDVWCSSSAAPSATSTSPTPSSSWPRCGRALGGRCPALGADRQKSLDRLLPAYDDAGGVTAAFNKNVLGRINRELGGDFELDRFRHVALWNEERSRVEMHLESLQHQTVRVRALGTAFTFARGERIHTESSHKYSDTHIDRLLTRSGFVRERSFVDDAGSFGVHVARAES